MYTFVSPSKMHAAILAGVVTICVWTQVAAGEPCSVHYFDGSLRFRMLDRRDPTLLRRVYAWEPGANTEQIIYESPHPLGRVNAGKTGLIAFREARSENYMVIRGIDVTGNVRFEVQHEKTIWDFVWNPCGTKIAYIAGDFHDRHPRGIDSAGVWIYDVDSGVSEQIAESGHTLSWPSFDGCVYISVGPGMPDHVVLRYDPETGATDETEFLSTDFSADGKYYLHFSGIAGFQVYERETNALVRELPNGTDLVAFLRRFAECRWLNTGTFYLPLSVPAEPVYERHYLVLKLESGALFRARNRLLASCGEESVIVMKEDGSLALERYDEMTSVSAQNIIETIEPKSLP